MNRYMSNAKASRGALGLKPDEDQGLSEWQVDLFDCCREPCLSKFLVEFLIIRKETQKY